jgi:SAM-dependent methyltransferase
MLPLVEPFPPCPVCAHPNPRPLHVMRNLRPIVQVPFLTLGGCPSCGFVYTWPRPSEAQLAEYYDPDADDGWERGGNLDDPEQLVKLEKTLAQKREKGRRLLDAIAGWSPIAASGERDAFDFGCGAGSLLDVLQDRGWTTTGLEPHRLRDVAARRHRLVEEIPDTPSFDLVMVHHVLEHLLNPAQELSSLARATREGGVLLCSMPDLGGLPEHRSFTYVASAVHINSFTTANVENLLQRSGWRVVRAQSGGFLPERSSKDGERMMVLAVRDDTAARRPMRNDALAVAEDALRRYGRQLGADGKLRQP